MYAMMAGRFPFSDIGDSGLEHKIRCNELQYLTGISKEGELIILRLRHCMCCSRATICFPFPWTCPVS
jgi:hypothetical protein